MDARLLHVNPALPEPIYRQIAEQLRRLVSAGQLRPGDALPSVREVAAAHAINPMTVSRAYSQLEAEGVLERLRGKGMAVAARRQRSDSVAARMQQLEPALREAARHGRELELPVDRVLARLRQLLEEEDA
ncbi:MULTISPECIES: GntR family transcriptional regulator [Pseudoxanthomonas]|uniref:GntR family transcriptional regulator n=1 Tax=Pseudoxanthomonas TaxID=83618 RepID=UPI00048FBBEC|nr:MULTISPECIES: GntR family transcriptional regulator [Pseudoxanthomonas]KAF1695781.1 GntR family transcriptional regulator [Pseudoxanthomonas jiangsuensis]